MIRAALPFLLCLGLAACGSGGQPSDIRAAVECAPFARALTGVALSGAAADWWRSSTGRYDHASRPEVGSLLVFRRSGRLPNGHVAVVSKVLGRRDILVTQANWQHHHVGRDQPVVDVSPGNDWTSVQVWWPPAGAMGTHAYATFGFIRPDGYFSHDRLIAATPQAVRIAENGR